MWLKHLQPGERQKPIAGWVGYFVTDHGVVGADRVCGAASARVCHVPL